jgi:hypothetical protein
VPGRVELLRGLARLLLHLSSMQAG